VLCKKGGCSSCVLSPLLILFLNYSILHFYISSLIGESKLHVPVLILAILVMMIILVVYIVKILRAHEVTIRNVNKAIFIIASGLIIFNIFSIALQSIATARITKSAGMTGIPLQKT